HTSIIFFISSRRLHTRFSLDWSSDVCSSDLPLVPAGLMQCNSNAPAQELPKRVSGMGPQVGRLNVGAGSLNQPVIISPLRGIDRSEERRVGKEGTARWWRIR